MLTLLLPSPVHAVPQESLLWAGDPNQYECLARTLENGKSAFCIIVLGDGPLSLSKLRWEKWPHWFEGWGSFLKAHGKCWKPWLFQIITQTLVLPSPCR